MNLKKVKERMDVSFANAVNKVEKRAKKQYNKVVGEGRKRRREREDDEETDRDESRDEGEDTDHMQQSNAVIPPSIDDCARTNEMKRRNEELERRNEEMRKEMVALRIKIERLEEEKREGEMRYRRALIMMGRRD